jgi:hypothetical protein
MPPALETAAQKPGLQSHIMAPQIMGYLIPNISVMAVLNMSCLLLAFFAMNCHCRTASLNQNRSLLSTPFVIPGLIRVARKLLDSLT